MSKQLGAARRRRHVGPSANQERNFVGLLDTTKINIIFVGLAAGTAEKDKTIIRALLLFVKLLALGFTERDSHISRLSNVAIPVRPCCQ